MRCRNFQAGFSLLELIIVLVVMIGMMAVVWPNLQRPLSRTSLDEAAQLVRSAIDESRYQATLAGSPWFIKFETGGTSIMAGTFDAFMESTPTSPVRIWRLPEHVLVASLHWRSFGSAATSQDNWDLALSDLQATDTALGPRAAVDKERAFYDLNDQQNDSPPGEEAQFYWLPILASGRGRDATIKLWDKTTLQSIEVHFVSATGAIEVLR
jgi:prepilin-type N-terminal cleavage/methylation domain-containing protein